MLQPAMEAASMALALAVSASAEWSGATPLLRRAGHGADDGASLRAVLSSAEALPLLKVVRPSPGWLPPASVAADCSRWCGWATTPRVPAALPPAPWAPRAR